MLKRLCLASALTARMLAAQDAPRDPRTVQPERPTVATHAHTVATGYAEIETGVQGDRVGPGQRSWSAPTVVKLGLSEHTQLNLVIPGYLPTAGQTGGVGDIGVGLKWRLLDDSPILGDFALLPSVKFATASATNGLGSGHSDLGLTLISSHDLKGGIAMDINAIYTRESVGSMVARDAALWTLSFGLPVTEKLGWALELFGQPTIDGSHDPSTAALLTGPTYVITTAFSIDAGFITPLHGALPNSLYAGLVWNLGRILPGGGSSPSQLARRR